MKDWTNNLIQYTTNKNPGECPVCGSTDIEVIKHENQRKSISFKCRKCGKSDHFDGCASS